MTIIVNFIVFPDYKNMLTMKISENMDNGKKEN